MNKYTGLLIAGLPLTAPLANAAIIWTDNPNYAILHCNVFAAASHYTNGVRDGYSESQSFWDKNVEPFEDYSFDDEYWDERTNGTGFVSMCYYTFNAEYC